jgi:hypothetical protein
MSRSGSVSLTISSVETRRLRAQLDCALAEPVLREQYWADFRRVAHGLVGLGRGRVCSAHAHIIIQLSKQEWDERARSHLGVLNGSVSLVCMHPAACRSWLHCRYAQPTCITSLCTRCCARPTTSRPRVRVGGGDAGSPRHACRLSLYHCITGLPLGSPRGAAATAAARAGAAAGRAAAAADVPRRPFRRRVRPRCRRRTRGCLS